ncbi:FAD-dependent oxidoreductase [Actinoplanes lobatus]|uniref:FAD-dependent oxidoreductase n=1 Tax=Actinoplanes lobatus TaxID=113568 RepID=A0A7W7H8R8_9ACTN|nr:FAD-dependent monooxygenase [Actinoplanes lobatus]MBB4745902.1 2-polyprenyl-6-methoxyphenol hydroxylase-like FAD-dependent oxidoreductase [Actinoplanes lobatus]GGN89288.1 FAD-dependent oxidoreductase [Actinoplanes lobatus]GIE43609.1 FAD-dependent oxidoreductase [Actinoplanes lobatus]
MHTTVAIIGAGPTGLLLAGDLAHAGIPVTVFERRSGTSNLTRAFGVHARTLELLDARGLADGLIAEGARVRRLRLFNGIELDLSRLPSRFPYLLITPQYRVEHALAERALKAGAEFRHGARLTRLRQDDGLVTLDLEDGDTVTADYVVGADGLHSTVRQSLGLPFPGKAVLTSIMLADVRLATPPEDVLAVGGVGDAFAMVAPFGDGWYRIFAWNRDNQVDDRTPVTLDEISAVTRRVHGTDFGITETRWMSRFHSDERQAPHYRVGRVFLAGDAAHVHSPAGGQGMNTGLQDAANLSWKLAATIAGRTPEGLLDTYEAERHPVGRMVLRSSGTLIRAAMIRSAAGRLARDTLGRILLGLPPVARRAAGIISGVGISYPGAPRAADVTLRDGGRLYEALRDGRHVLLTDQNPEGYEDRVLVAAPGSTDGTACLIRPDGYVAWRGPAADAPAAVARLLP